MFCCGLGLGYAINTYQSQLGRSFGVLLNKFIYGGDRHLLTDELASRILTGASSKNAFQRHIFKINHLLMIESKRR